MITLKGNYYKGRVGWTASYLKKLAAKQQSIAYINGSVYDFTEYLAGGRQPQYPAGTKTP